MGGGVFAMRSATSLLITPAISEHDLYKLMLGRLYQPWLLSELADLSGCSYTVLEPVLWQLTRSGFVEFNLIQNGSKAQDYSWSIKHHD
jgi:hypothetical protein